MDPDELVLLAHLLGDGCVLPRQPVHYTSADPANLEAVEAAARRRFGITPRRVVQDRWGHTYLPSSHHLTHGLRNPITAWWDDLGLHDCRSHQKFIPDDVHRAAADQIALFLRHLWATDGSLSLSRSIAASGSSTAPVRLYYASTSRRLVDGVQQLLLRLGIQSRIIDGGQGEHRPGLSPPNRWRGATSARFSSGLVCTVLAATLVPEALRRFDGIVSNPNVDTIPDLRSAHVIVDALGEAGMSSPRPGRGDRRAVLR